MSKQQLSYYLLWIAFIFPTLLFAQNVSFTGKVVDAINGSPIVAANIEVLHYSVYSFTNENGTFNVNVMQGEYTLQISSLGYETVLYKHTFSTSSDAIFTIKLQPLNLALQEITVTAEQGAELASSSKISRIALDHVQPISLADIMQLVPGNLIENPDLSSPQQIKIREISNDANSALGTTIIVDGNPINNDANLQTSNTARMSSDNNEVQQPVGIRFPTTSGMGVDLRQFSTNNIESVEIIQGVPSVEYGNLTSAAVIVQTKAGATPLSLKFKSDPYVKQFYVGKGLQLKGKGGAINVSLDYLNAYDDVVSKYKGYDRLNGQLGYYKVFMSSQKPLTLNTKINVYSSIDNTKTDPDAMVPDEEYRSSDRGFNFSASGKWLLDASFLTAIKYAFSGSISHQESYQKRYRSGSQQGISTSLVAGENYGILLPIESLTEYTVDGKPYQLFGQITAYKDHYFRQNSKNTMTVGADYRIRGNSGDGQMYDITNPPYVNVNALRPRAYNDIPSMSTVAFYVADNLKLSMGRTLLEVELGARFNNFQPSGVASSNFGFFAEPRGNIRYTFIDNQDKNLKNLAIRLGAGKLYKTPPLLSLYPNNAYIDLLSLQHYTTNVDTRTFVYTTSIFNTENVDLKPTENTKLEIGLDVKIGKVKGSFTAFREESENGIGFTHQYEFLNYKRYDSSGVPEGEVPDIGQLPYSTQGFIAEYRKPVNIKSAVKQGVEYTLDFNKIRTISTQFVLDGAWLRTSRTYQSVPYQFQPGSSNANAYEYVGKYPAGGGKVEERFNSILRMITHVPKLALVFTTSVQVIWYEKYYFPYYEEVPLYLFNETEKIPFTTEMKEDPVFRYFVNERPSEYYLEETLPTLMMVNFRLSKEIGKFLKFSFYVNNFLNYRPTYELERSGANVRRNQSVYFGADIQIRL